MFAPGRDENDGTETRGEEMMPDGRVASAARSIEAAALAGLAHVVLFVAARVMLLRLPTPDDSELSAWYTDVANQRSVVVALNLMAISCIAFLWFVAVIRRRVGLRENRFFGTVFLGSALLTAAIWLLGSLLLATPAVDAYTYGTVQDEQTVSGWQAVGTAAFTIVAIRFEAVFIISATTVGRLSDAFPRFLVAAGYGAGLLLLLAPVPASALTWIFTAWVSLVSCVLLFRNRELETQLREPVPHV